MPHRIFGLETAPDTHTTVYCHFAGSTGLIWSPRYEPLDIKPKHGPFWAKKIVSVKQAEPDQEINVLGRIDFRPHLQFKISNTQICHKLGQAKKLTGWAVHCRSGILSQTRCFSCLTASKHRKHPKYR